MTLAIRLAAGTIGVASLWVMASPALAARDEVTIDDSLAYPESITSLADGTVILGSLTKPVIYRARPQENKAVAWIHLTEEENLSTAGVLADPGSKMLWACVFHPLAATGNPVAGAPPAPPRRVSTLRGFDLSSGAPRASYPLPEATNFCNDITLGPHGVLYVSDTANGRVLRLKPGSKSLEIWAQDTKLMGVDGLTFVGPTLYVNTVTTGHVYRLPILRTGESGAPVDITLSQPLTGPDGMRSSGKHVFVAENRAGRVSELVIKGDAAQVTVIKSGYVSPTAVSPTGKILWVGEAKLAYRNDPKLQGQDPGLFKAYALPMPH